MKLLSTVLIAGFLTVPVSAASAQTVPPELKIKAPRVIASGLPLEIAGSGGQAGEQIRLEVARGSAWKQVLVTTASTRGTFRFAYRPAAASGSYKLRAAAGSRLSPTVTVRQRTVTLAAVGDVNLGDVPGAAIARYGPNWPWTSVGPSLRRADIAMANLECAISLRGAPVPKAFRFRGKPSSLRAMARAGGIDVVNLANNHAGDYGDRAFLDTLRYSRDFGLVPIGGGVDRTRALRPGVVTRLGLRVAFVGFSSIGPASFAAGQTSPGTAWATARNVRTAVRSARRRADVVVATFHWGIELARSPSADQRRLAAVALASGAAAVIGAHPHVLQPIGAIRGSKLIAYSLGNFVFGANSPGTENTGILKLELSRRGVQSRSFRSARIVGGRPILR